MRGERQKESESVRWNELRDGEVGKMEERGRHILEV